jgi:glycosyltransferase involved in cell wall biosynthesis
MNAGQRPIGADRDGGGRWWHLLGGGIGVVKHAVPTALRPRVGRFEPQYRPRPLSVPRSYLRERPPSPAPSISVVTPSLNQGRFIRATLASVVGQGYPRLEYIVADGGSSDETLDVLADYSDRIDRLESAPDGGPAVAINRELGRAGGQILCWLNSDDILLPGALAHVARFFVAHPQVDLVYGYRVLIDERGDDIGLWTMPPHTRDALRWIDLVPQETAFWRRDLWRRVGGLDQGLEIAFDWDFFRRAEAAGARIARLPRFLAAMRQHRGQTTRAREPESIAEQAAIRARELDQPLTKAQTRARLLGYLLRSLPYQYAHVVRARLGVRRVPVSLPAATSAHAGRPAGAAAGPGISLASPVSPSRRKGDSG